MFNTSDPFCLDPMLTTLFPPLLSTLCPGTSSTGSANVSLLFKSSKTWSALFLEAAANAIKSLTDSFDWIGVSLRMTPIWPARPFDSSPSFQMTLNFTCFCTYTLRR